jgi:hypothetical protein
MNHYLQQLSSQLRLGIVLVGCPHLQQYVCSSFAFLTHVRLSEQFLKGGYLQSIQHNMSEDRSVNTSYMCEELTTYETREVVAVPNSRSRGGV